jgi:hypothetical protein
VLFIRGIEGGTYNIILQGMVITSDLSTASSSSDISNALTNAAANIDGSVRECLYFGVSSVWSSSRKVLKLTVTFGVDNTQPLTLLDAYTPNLLGK